MRIIARVTTVAIAALMVLGGSACKKEKKDQAAQAKALGRSAEVPKEVMLYVGIRNPQSTIDETLALIKTFVPLPIEREGLLDLLAQRARLPRDLLAAIDLAGTFWVVALDEKLTGERDAGVLALPLRSRKEFEAALAKKMDKGATEGALTLYKPKAQEPGLQEMRLLIEDQVVMVPTSKKSLDMVQPFVRSLLESKAGYDVAVHVMVGNILKRPGQNLDGEISRVLDKVRTKMPASAGGIDTAPLASALGDRFRQVAEMFKTTREIIITLDVEPQQVTLSLRGEAQPGGLLDQTIRKQRPGPALGHKLLPAASWLVISNLSNAQADEMRKKSWEGLAQVLFKGSDPAKTKPTQEAFVTLAQQFYGDVTVAFHRPPSGSGVAVSSVARVADATRAERAMEKLAQAFGDYAQQKLKETPEPEAKGLKAEKRAFSHKGAKGAVVELTVPFPEDKRERMAKLFGPKLVFGWAFTGEHALFSAGKDAEQELEAMASGAAGGKVEGNLSDNPAFLKAQSAAPGRTGLVYLSLVDLARWLEGTGVGEAEAIAAALKDKKVATAPSLDWGVNAARTQFDVSLHLPAEHFRAFKPIWDELLKKGGPPSLFGPRARWREVER
jgi:hypothetical protein